MPRCPKCGAAVGVLTLLWQPPGREFECAKCGRALRIKPQRATAIAGAGVVAMLLPGLWTRAHWVSFAIAALVLMGLAYVFLATVESIEPE
jgi:hypothetical protein